MRKYRITESKFRSMIREAVNGALDETIKPKMEIGEAREFLFDQIRRLVENTFGTSAIVNEDSPYSISVAVTNAYDNGYDYDEGLTIKIDDSAWG